VADRAPGGGASVSVTATDGAARTGTLTTARGVVALPCFMPVGTRGAVRACSAEDLTALGAEVMLANTYHLMLRPGAELVAELGGIHGFSSFTGHVLTDSGGYQTFSLRPQIDDDGVTFRSVYDGSSHRLTPERAVAVQELLGADIQMVLDVCAPVEASSAELSLAVERTASWARRAKAAHRRRDQALFGIVQGGLDPALRQRSAEQTVAVDFDGYGIGGLSVGEPRSAMLDTLDHTVPLLPAAQARYLMGVGTPDDIIAAVLRGIDMFDCVIPTRAGRTARAYTSRGVLNLRNARFADDPAPLDPACACPACARHARAYLHHLFRSGEILGPMLLTWHNLHYYQALMRSLRAAILAGRLGAAADTIRAGWAEGDAAEGDGAEGERR